MPHSGNQNVMASDPSFRIGQSRPGRHADAKGANLPSGHSFAAEGFKAHTEMFGQRGKVNLGGNVQLVPGVPFLRKEPRQQRTVELIKAITEACVQILIEDGAKGVTAVRLSDLSGVATASIYEWFESINSVISYSLTQYFVNINYSEYLHLFSISRYESIDVLIEEMVVSAFSRSRFIYENCYKIYNESHEFMKYVDNTVFIGDNIIDGYDSPVHALISGYKDINGMCNSSVVAGVLKESLSAASRYMIINKPMALYNIDDLRSVTKMFKGMFCH